MELKNSRFGKDLTENPEVVSRNQLNTSKAKMQYSFAQSDRFSHAQKMSCTPNKFYDLPNLWKAKEKGTSLGYGQKMDLSKRSFNTPAPGCYQLKSSFNKKQNEGITMGPGRDVIRNRDMFSTSKMRSPNSTTYHPVAYTNTRAYSIGQKIERQDNKWLKNVPGPGNYSVMELTNQRSKKMVSKYASALNGKFSRSQRKGAYQTSITPGPGSHQIISNSFGESIYDKAYSSKFGTGPRRGIIQKSTLTPGPGSYEKFSEFLH